MALACRRSPLWAGPAGRASALPIFRFVLIGIADLAVCPPTPPGGRLPLLKVRGQDDGITDLRCSHFLRTLLRTFPRPALH